MEHDAIFNDIEATSVESPKGILMPYIDAFNKVFTDSFVGEVREILTDTIPDILDDTVVEDIFSESRTEPTTKVRMEVIVPPLNKYIVDILDITYKKTILYPCTLSSCISSTRVICESGEILEQNLVSLFKSPEFRSIISNLLGQIREQQKVQ